MEYKMETPFTKEDIKKLRAGDKVFISGIIYTGRDAAHKKLIEMVKKKSKLPFDIKNQIIYYMGPSPTKKGEIIGSAGPTTSGRMDVYTPMLISLGLTGMIGKGNRDITVINAMKTHFAAYFGATGGAAALISSRIISQKIIAFPELGTEAIRMLKVVDFQVIVLIDCYGNNIYDIGVSKYKR